MKSDAFIQRNVQDALNFDPALKPGEIGVIVKDGIVILTGTVDNYAKKSSAEKVVRRIKGVKAVVEKIEVQLAGSSAKSDSDIAREISEALQWNYAIPEDKIKVRVENGNVTLDGSVPWDYQRKAAHKEIARITGVRSITNRLSIQSVARDALEKATIDEAISRHWSLDAEDVYIRVKDNTVTLTGEVDSLYQKDEAERIAWLAPGVQEVDNLLEVKGKLAAY